MIAFLKGEIEELEEAKVLLDVNGVGYGVFITGRDASALSGRRDRVKLFTYLQVREDAMQLYGFLKKDDLHVFQLLLGVNGIGPKAALGMLSALSANDIRFAVLAGDAKAIARAPGIGPKTAQKMILDTGEDMNTEDLLKAALKKLSLV